MSAAASPEAIRQIRAFRESGFVLRFLANTNTNTNIGSPMLAWAIKQDVNFAIWSDGSFARMPWGPR